MKIRFLVIGKTTDKYILPGLAEYEKRLKRYVKLEYIELPGVKVANSMSLKEGKEKEGDYILSKIDPSDYLILLDELGQEFNSVKFANFIQKKVQETSKPLTFLVGGAYGFSEKVYQRANAQIALSKMTFTHQMVRLIFMEQLYRAMTILKGEKYHH